MPIGEGALESIRAQFDALRKGERVRLITVGTLTERQLEAINRARRTGGYPPLIGQVVFIGRHVYESRIVRDAYSIDDVVEQLASGLASTSVVLATSGLTAMENPLSRADRYGNFVRDRIILECSARYPRPELFSAVPKGDRIKPKRPPTT